MTHRERMRERRQRQLARKPGFTPVHNRRIAAAIAAEMVLLVDAGMDEFRAELTAIRTIARQLPPPPFQRRHRAPRPSKSDNPDYRKLNPARAMACAG